MGQPGVIMSGRDNDQDHEKAAFPVSGLPGLKQACGWRCFCCDPRRAGVRAAAPRPVETHPFPLVPLCQGSLSSWVNFSPLEPLPPRGALRGRWEQPVDTGPRYWVGRQACHPVTHTPPPAGSGQLAGGPNNEVPLIPPRSCCPFSVHRVVLALCFHGDKSSKSRMLPALPFPSSPNQREASSCSGDKAGVLQS